MGITAHSIREVALDGDASGADWYWRERHRAPGSPVTRGSQAYPRISVIIPARNEALNLPHVLARIPASVSEVVLVDGHSHDATIAVARALRPDITVVRQRRRGKGDAVRCGLAAARGDIVVLLDADGSTDPQEIDQFVAPLLAGADFVKGSRFAVGGGSADITPIRRLGNAALNGLVNLLFGASFTDLCYGYNAFWRECLECFAVDCDGFEVETLLNLRAHKANLRIVEAPSYEQLRIHGVSNLHAFRDGLRVLRTIMREWRDGRSVVTDRRYVIHHTLRDHLLGAALADPAVDADATETVYALASVAADADADLALDEDMTPTLIHPTPRLKLAATNHTHASATSPIPLSNTVRHTQTPVDRHNPRPTESAQADFVADRPSGANSFAGRSAVETAPEGYATKPAVAGFPSEATVIADVSVVIAAYTRRRWPELVAAIRSAQRQSVAPREVLLVIDHNPALAELARTAFPEITILENVGLVGLGATRNVGLTAARGAYIAFLDDDAVADPDWLASLLRVGAHEGALGVGGAIIPDWRVARPRWFPAEFGWVVGCGYRGLPRRLAPTRNLIGASMLIRREVFDAIGGFRVDLGRVGERPVGCEETELCVRARQRWPGRVFLYEPRARVRHVVPASRSTWRYFRDRCYHEGRSKAMMARSVGARDGLASERAYTLRTLPLGVARHLGAVVARRDPSGLARAMALIAGLALTILGYLSLSLSMRSRHV